MFLGMFLFGSVPINSRDDECICFEFVVKSRIRLMRDEYVNAVADTSTNMVLPNVEYLQ